MKIIGTIVLVATYCGCVPALAQSPAEILEAGKEFEARCVSCHQAPDLRFGSDRAWLDQVHRTA